MVEEQECYWDMELEYLDSVILVIAHVNRPCFADGYSSRSLELSRSQPVTPKRGQVLPVQRVCNYNAVAVCAHIQVLFVSKNVGRGGNILSSEWVLAVSSIHLTRKHFDEAPIWIEDLDVFVVGIAHIDVAIRGTGDTENTAEFPTATALAADGLMECEVSANDLNTCQICQVDLSVDRVECNGFWLGEVLRFTAVLAHKADVTSRT